MKRMHVDEHYSAYLEGSLPEALRRKVETHLRECQQCAAELEDMRRMIEDLSRLPMPPLPANFGAGVRARLTPRPQRQFFSWRMPALAAGTLAAAVALVMVFTSLSQRPTLPVAKLPNKMVEKPAAKQQANDAGKARPLEKSAPSATALHGPYQHKMSPQKKENIIVRYFGGVTDASPLPDSTTVMEPVEGKTSAPIVVALAPPDSSLTFTRSSDDAANKSLDILAANRSSVVSEASAAPGAAAAAPGEDIYGRADGIEGPQGPAGAQGSPNQQPPTIAFGDLTADSMSADSAFKATKTKNELELNDSDIKLDGYISDPPVTLHFDADTSGKEEYNDRARYGQYYGRDTAFLRINALPQDELSINYALPSSRNKDQKVAISGRPVDVNLQLPPLVDGAAIKLSLSGANGRETGDDYYLILPGNEQAKTAIGDKGALMENKKPCLQELLTISKNGGMVILCPAAFADAEVIPPSANSTPQDALNQLAEQANFRVIINGSVVNIVAK